MIPEGTIKLAITLGEPPQIATVVINFLAVNYISAFNRILNRQLLMAPKAVTSIHYLTMKFPIAVGTRQVRGRQRDSREYYSRSL